MVIVSAWLIGGLFVDGWAHNTRPRLETFYTPWHAIFYSGFAVTVGWVGWLCSHQLRPARAIRASVPAGYWWTVIGIGIFAVSAVGDLIWHTLFGIERDVAALLSPTHLGLFTGATLIITGPWRAARHRTSNRAAPLAELAPAVVSLTLAGCLCAFILQEWHPFKINPISIGTRTAILAEYPTAGRDVLYDQVRAGVASFLIATLCLFTPIVVLLRTWTITARTVAVVLGIQVVLMQAVVGFRDPGLMALGLIGATTAAGLARLIQPTPTTVTRQRVYLLVAPAMFWAVYVTGVGIADHGLGWKPELYGGVIVWSGLVTSALHALVTQPALDQPRHPNPTEAGRTGP